MLDLQANALQFLPRLYPRLEDASENSLESVLTVMALDNPHISVLPATMVTQRISLVLDPSFNADTPIASQLSLRHRNSSHVLFQSLEGHPFPPSICEMLQEHMCSVPPLQELILRKIGNMEPSALSELLVGAGPYVTSLVPRPRWCDYCFGPIVMYDARIVGRLAPPRSLDTEWVCCSVMCTTSVLQDGYLVGIDH